MEPQPHTTEKTPLAVSHSLSAISSLTKSSGKFDLKSSSTFLSKGDGERDTNRDSIAVVEDNRVELERLVEQINSDLSSAQKAKDAEEEIKRTRKVSTSSIERFLSSTAQPIIPPKNSSQHLQVPVQQTSMAVAQQQTDVPLSKQQAEMQPLQQETNAQAAEQTTNVYLPLRQAKAPDMPHSTIQSNTESCSHQREQISLFNTHLHKDQTRETFHESKGDLQTQLQATATYKVSDDQNLEVLLTENILLTENGGRAHDTIDGTRHATNNRQPSVTFDVTADVNSHDESVNDILDRAGQSANTTLELILEEFPANVSNSVAEQKSKTTPKIAGNNKCRY